MLKVKKGSKILTNQQTHAPNSDNHLPNQTKPQRKTTTKSPTKNNGIYGNTKVRRKKLLTSFFVKIVERQWSPPPSDTMQSVWTCSPEEKKQSKRASEREREREREFQPPSCITNRYKENSGYYYA